MSRAVFIIRDSIRGAVRDWKINFMFISVLFGAVLLSIYCIASIRFLKQDLKQARYRDIERTVEAGFFGSPLDQTAVRSVMSEGQGERVSVSGIKKMYLPALNNRSWFVLGIDESYTKYKHIEVGSGRIPAFSDESAECIIGEQCAKENDLSPGDTVRIDGIDFQIAGIAAQRRYRSYIIVPYGQTHRMGSWDSEQQTVLMTGKGLQPDRMEGLLAGKMGGSLLYCENALDLYRQNEKVIQRWIRLRAAACAIGMVFAAFNILSVCLGKIQEQKKEYLTKKVLGLTEGGVLLTFFFENFMITVLSCGLAWKAFTPLARLLDIDSVVLADGKTAAVIFILAASFSFIYSLILKVYLNRCPVIEILQEDE